MPTTARFGRRAFVRGALLLPIPGLIGGCGWFPLQAPRPARLPAIGYLSPDAAGATPGLLGFQRGLVDLGYVDGQNVRIEYRYAEGDGERLHGLAAELVSLPVDVILAQTNPAVQAVRQATSTIPIVTVSNDPVGAGLAVSLARPGGNVTGVSTVSDRAVAKRLELLKEVVPAASRVAVLWNPANPAKALDWEQISELTPKVGLELLSVEAPGADPNLEAAFDTAVSQHADALMVLNEPTFSHEATRLALIAISRRMPTMQDRTEYAVAGSLMAYGVNTEGLYRRLAAFVDRILKGARPADLPFEQPTTFDFVINLQTARALGLTVPPPVLQQATQVIQ